MFKFSIMVPDAADEVQLRELVVERCGDGLMVALPGASMEDPARVVAMFRFARGKLELTAWRDYATAEPTDVLGYGWEGKPDIDPT